MYKLSSLILFAIGQIQVVSALQSGGFGYTNVGASITITNYSGTGGAVVIPSSINALPVSAIGDKVFANHSEITNIVIPNSVKNIGNEVFSGCANLKNLIIPNSVTNIGEASFLATSGGPFDNCNSLTNIVIPPILLGDLYAYGLDQSVAGGALVNGLINAFTNNSTFIAFINGFAKAGPTGPQGLTGATGPAGPQG